MAVPGMCWQQETGKEAADLCYPIMLTAWDAFGLVWRLFAGTSCQKAFWMT